MAKQTPGQMALGKYRLVEKIGEGGMAEVFKAFDPDLEITVAIKVLKPSFARDPLVSSKFVEEARVAAKLRNQHIVRIMGFNQDSGRSFIVMEYLSGRPLNLLADGGVLALPRAVSVIEQLADALDYIHKRNLVHQDVKPANVIVGENDLAVLTDFGIVRALVPGQTTSSGVIIGSAMYMAPEQVKNEPISPATDIYCLGVVAYELVTGRAPFVAENLHAVMHMQAYETPPPMASIKVGIPTSVEQQVLRALAKKPNARPETASAFASDLRNAADGVATGLRAPARSRSTKVTKKSPDLPQPAEGSGLGTMPLVGALLATVVVAGLVFGINRGVTEPQRRLAEARGTATALAVAMIGDSPTRVTGIAVGASGDPATQVDLAATLSAERAAAVATVNSLETEVAAARVPLSQTVTPPKEPTRRLTPQPTRSPRPPVGPAIALSSPANGNVVSGAVAFKWNRQGSLPEGAVFDVRVCKGDCVPSLGKTNVRESSWTWCPDEGDGTYHWQVLTIGSSSHQSMGESSSVGSFSWTGGCGGDEKPSAGNKEVCKRPDLVTGKCRD